MKEWLIGTPIGEMTVGIGFFKTVTIKKTKVVENTVFVTLDDGQTFSIWERDFTLIQEIIRDYKINQILS
jgi:hypothetical protein